jgi:hypothetical protein
MNPIGVNLIKNLVWVYFFLLIFEGALRKWVLPGLATPLLIIRDPVALLAILTAYKYKMLKSNRYLNSMIVLTLISLMATMAFGHGNIMVAIYGARIILIHLTFMFLIGQILDYEDVVKIGKAVLIISIPMALLIGMQFYSPQSALVNRGIGGSAEGGGFNGGAQGYFRPPGTFSFTVGNVQFFSLVSVFVLYFLFNLKNVNKIIVIGSAFALIAAVPLSISRGLLFQVLIGLIFVGISISGDAKNFGKLLTIVFFGFIVIFILKDTPFFQTATGAFTERFETANEAEGGVESMFLDRFLGGLLTAVTGTDGLPLFGHGLGMGTNVGAQLLFGSAVFLIAEGEWGRTVGEMGPLLGILIIFVRSTWVFSVFFKSFQKIKEGEILPWLLMSFGFLLLLQGQLSQPTSVGFVVLVGGLVIASLKDKPEAGSLDE